MTNTNVQAISSFMSARGLRTYLVGGAVRDYFMARAPQDNDVLVAGCSVDRLAMLLSELPTAAEIDFVGKSFGVFKVKFVNGEVVDVAAPRTEVSVGAGHRDFEVLAGGMVTVESDAARRDFTMNSIALEVVPTGGFIIHDPFGGRMDIDSGIIRAVGNAAERFTEDPLRILRAFRFQARYDFALATETAIAISENKGLLERPGWRGTGQDSEWAVRSARGSRNVHHGRAERDYPGVAGVCRVQAEQPAPLRNGGQPRTGCF
jgi:tRNA nucleotidyltransferase (CCA-adding enzyme)